MSEQLATSQDETRVFFGSYLPGMKLADLHVHTRFSDGWWTPEALATAALERGLSAIAVTDHDGVRGAYAVAEACAQRNLPLIVIPGSEISAREGNYDVHVLGLNLVSDVPPWMSVAQTVDAIFAQGGVAVIPHPKAAGIGFPTFEQILSAGSPVAVEIFNSSVQDLRPLTRRQSQPNANREARSFYTEYAERLLGAVGGTDAHFRTIGRGLTAYDGDLLQAIRERRTAVLFRSEGERLRLWDLRGYVMGLRRLDQRRAASFGPRPGGRLTR
jgi:predicted metal-dependent phosphoesterase TrpH